MKSFSGFAVITAILILNVVANASDAIYADDDKSSSTSKESEEEEREKRQVFNSVRRTGRPLADELNDFDSDGDQLLALPSPKPPVKSKERRGRSVPDGEGSGDSTDFAEAEERQRSEQAVNKRPVRPQPSIPPRRSIQPNPISKVYPTGGKSGRSASKESKEAADLSSEQKAVNNFQAPLHPSKLPSGAERRKRSGTQVVAVKRCKRARGCPLRRSGNAHPSYPPTHTYYAYDRYYRPQQVLLWPDQRRGRRLAANQNGFETSNKVEQPRVTRRPRPTRRRPTTAAPPFKDM